MNRRGSKNVYDSKESRRYPEIIALICRRCVFPNPIKCRYSMPVRDVSVQPFNEGTELPSWNIILVECTKRVLRCLCVWCKFFPNNADTWIMWNVQAVAILMRIYIHVIYVLTLSMDIISNYEQICVAERWARIRKRMFTLFGSSIFNDSNENSWTIIRSYVSMHSVAIMSKRTFWFIVISFHHFICA